MSIKQLLSGGWGFVELFLSHIPFFFVALTLSNIFYLSFISIFPSLLLDSTTIALAHILFFVASMVTLWKYRFYFSLGKIKPKSLLILIPALIIMFMRFPMLFPTLDDLAVHMMYGDLANTLWYNTNFVPLDFLTYFYLVLDMNYTPFLYTVGIRLTILMFDLIATFWLFSIFTRLKRVVKTDLQRISLDALFLIIPFIPHVMATLGTLMTDYITIPIGLEALYLFLKRDKDKTFAVHMTILLVLAKLSPATFVILPLLYYIVKERKNIRWIEVFTFVGISSVYFVRQYIETGSPFFGLYNGIFKSPLYPLSNFSNPLFGPQSILQFISWPIIGQFTERYAEGIVSQYAQIFFAPLPILGYAVSILLCIKKRSVKYALVVFSYMLWSYLAGYARYYELLNIIALLLFIMDLKNTPRVVQPLLKYRNFSLFFISVLCFTSFKTDFSWRYYPSFLTPGANEMFIQKYKEGLSFVAKDTIPKISAFTSPIFNNNYDAILTAYRGSSTFISYMGHLQGLPMINGVYANQYDNILTSSKISKQIKQNLKKVENSSRVLLLADESFKVIIPSLWISQYFKCNLIGTGDKLPYFQREFYFETLYFYSCEK